MTIVRMLRRAARSVSGKGPSTDGAKRPGGDELSSHLVHEVRNLASSGRLIQALGKVSIAMETSGKAPQLLSLRGGILFESARISEARSDLADAVRLGIEEPSALVQLGWTHLWVGSPGEAEACMRRAVESAPADWMTYYGLAATLRARRAGDEAIATLHAALGQSPDNPECLTELVTCMIDAGRLDEAESLARRAVGISPNSPAALGTLANVLIRQDRFAEATRVYEAIGAQTAPDGTPMEIPLDAGIPLRDGGRVEAAIHLYERHLPGRPDSGAHAHYAFSLLKGGRLREGWEQYEFRWVVDPLRSLRPRFDKPVWNGQALTGRTILISGEQGIGDVIQFLRYVPHVKALGATVIFYLRKPMREIVERIEGIDHIVDFGGAIPPFDYYIHVMSLARVFGSELATIPASVPYVRAVPTLVDAWKRRLGSDQAFRVGIVWTADPAGLRCAQKSVPLSLLTRLAAVPGVRLYSLQKGEGVREAAEAAREGKLVDLSPDIASFADTAAIVASLDLVVTICTSVAHLAGAMGARTWTLLAEPADWRWLERRSDTPWYPTLRLFRQPRQGDWASVIGEVRAELETLLRDRQSFTPDPPPAFMRPTSLSPQRPRPSDAASICRILEAREGVFQFLPERSIAERSLAWYGEYLQAHVDLLRHLIRSGSAVLEAGAGIGAHTIPLAAIVGEQGLLWISEHRPDLRAVLLQNLQGNRCGPVTLLRTGLYGQPSDALGNRGAAEVATIDELYLPRLDWLKIGEDAAAETIIDGAVGALWTYRPGIFIAIADTSNFPILAGRVHDLGYHCWRLDAPLFRPDNFNHCRDDIFNGRSMPGLLGLPEEADDSVLEGLPGLARL
jgi:Flp pilus assembly protein TadD